MTVKPLDHAPMNGQQLRTIADTIPGVLFQFYARGSGEWGLYYVSGRSKDLFGISGDPALFFQKFTAGVAPEEREAFLTSIDNAVRTAGKWDFSGKFIRPMGEEMYFHVISEPVRAGDELVFNGVLLDITAQEQARRALLAGDAQYRSLIETTGTGYVILDNDGRVMTANTEYLRLCGRSTLDEIQGRPVTDWTAPYDLERNAREVEQCFRKGHVKGLEIDYLKPDGTIQPVEINASIIPSGTGQILLTLCRDITGRRTAEKALKKEQDFSQLLLDTSPAFFVTIGEDGRTITMNKAMIDALEYSPEEIRGANYLATFVPEEDRQMLAGIFRDIVFNGKATLTESRIISKSGKVYLVEWHGHPMKHEDEMLAVFFSVGIDITTRKNAEKALKESEERYRILFESSRDAQMTIEPPLWNFTSCNPSTVQMFMARDEKEFTSKEPWELSPERQPDGRESSDKAREMIETAMQNGTHLFEWTHKRFNGEDFPATVLLSRVDLPGHVFLQATVWDITEQKRAEESLHLFKDLVEHSSDAIGMSTPEGRHYYQNESFNRLFGDIGDNPPDSVYADKAIGKDVFDTIMSGGIWQGEVKMFGKGGTLLDIFLRAYAIKNTDGRLIGLVGLHTDITERRQAEEALKESEEKFRVVFENANDSILLIAISPSGLPEKIVEVNETACLRMKYTREEFLRLLLREIDAPETWEKIHLHMKDLMEKGHATFEGVHVTKDGERIPVEISAHTFSLHGQGLVLAHVRDITERKRVEEAVRASENRYRTILENTGTAIILIEEDTRISLANAEFARLSGYSREEIEGKKNWTEFIVKEDLERMLAQHHLRRENHEAALKHYEFGFATKTGEIRTISLTIEVIPGTKQSVASLMDITERKQAEKDLRESEVKYRNILDNIQDVFYRSDRDGNLIMISPSGAKLLGVVSVNELLGQSIAGKIYADPDARIPLLDEMKKNGFVEDYEVDLKRKDGSVVSVSTDSHYYFDVSGNPLGVEGIFRDITKRKRAEDALKVSERTMKDIISFLPDATLVIDKNGVVLAWNHAMEEMTGVPVDQVIGKGDYEYALPFYHERRPITIDLILHDNPAVVAKYPFMNTEGNTRFSEIFIPHLNMGGGAHLWFAATPLYDAGGNLTGAIESIRDITALKQADEQLHLLLREKEILLREIHHRVGNTLQMAVSMMKMEVRRENDTRVRDLILVIKSRLDAIASTFGTVYHSDNMSRVNFQNVVRSIVGSHQSAYEPGEHPPQIDIHMDLPELGVDLALPLALITNELVNNALRHAFPERRGGKVTITGLEDGNGWIILTVSDNGQGLNEGIKPAESDTVGFTLVNLLLGQVGGSSSYTSSSNGTTFTIRVPRDAELDKSRVNEK